MKKWGLIAIALFIPFIIVWVAAGIGWAFITYVTVGVFMLIAYTSARARRRRTYYFDDDYEEHIVVTRRPSGETDIERGGRRHIPRINKRGADFITGAKGLRQRQQDAMNETKKNLWG
jgi:uncharacterized membrane protein YqaE (UPF0057 family)